MNERPQMRIALIISNIHHLGLTGQQKVGLTLARKLITRGAAVLIVTNSPSCKRVAIEDAEQDLKVAVIPGEATPASYVRSLGFIIGTVRAFNPDLIHGHGIVSAILVALLGRIMRTPTIQTVYERPSSPWFLGLPAILALPHIDRVLCSSDYLLHFLHNLRIIPVSKMLVLRYGIEDVWFLQEKDLGRAAPRRVVLFWGDAYRERGIETLIQAIPRVLEHRNDVEFVLAIRHCAPGYVKKIVELYHHGHAIVRQSRTGDVSELVREADLVVLPYERTTMQPPLTLVESMLSGKPIITTPVDANKELMGENERGILVEKGNAEGLASSIMMLLSDSEKSRTLSDNARRFARGIYDWDTALSRLLALYEEVCKRTLS